MIVCYWLEKGIGIEESPCIRNRVNWLRIDGRCIQLAWNGLQTVRFASQSMILRISRSTLSQLLDQDGQIEDLHFAQFFDERLVLVDGDIRGSLAIVLTTRHPFRAIRRLALTRRSVDDSSSCTTRTGAVVVEGCGKDLDAVVAVLQLSTSYSSSTTYYISQPITHMYIGVYSLNNK